MTYNWQIISKHNDKFTTYMTFNTLVQKPMMLMAMDFHTILKILYCNINDSFFFIYVELWFYKKVNDEKKRIYCETILYILATDVFNII